MPRIIDPAGNVLFDTDEVGEHDNVLEALHGRGDPTTEYAEIARAIIQHVEAVGKYTADRTCPMRVYHHHQTFCRQCLGVA